MKLAERTDHADELEERPGLAMAFERGSNERPERLTVTNDPNPADERQEARAVLEDILNADARELGWALVGLDRQYQDEEDAPPISGYVLYATFAPLGRKLGRGRTGGVQQIPDETVLEILILRGEGKSTSAIARELNERGVLTARGTTRWHDSTVRRVLESKYAQRIAADAARMALGTTRPPATKAKT